MFELWVTGWIISSTIGIIWFLSKKVETHDDMIEVGLIILLFLFANMFIWPLVLLVTSIIMGWLRTKKRRKRSE